MKRLLGLICILASIAIGQVEIERATQTLAYGELYMSAAVATNTTSGTPVKANGTTILRNPFNFDMPANNRLRYTGSQTKLFFCDVDTSTSSGTGSVRGAIFLSDTGVADLTSEIDRQYSSPSDHGASGTSFIVELAENDYVELFVDSLAGNPTLTVDHMVLSCVNLN